MAELQTLEQIKGDLSMLSLATVDAARKKWDSKWDWAKKSLANGTGSQDKVNEASEGLKILQKATADKKHALRLETTARFGQDGQLFTLRGADMPGSGALVGLGLSAGSNYSTFTFAYDADVREDFVRHVARLIIRLTF